MTNWSPLGQLDLATLVGRVFRHVNRDAIGSRNDFGKREGCGTERIEGPRHALAANIDFYRFQARHVQILVGAR